MLFSVGNSNIINNIKSSLVLDVAFIRNVIIITLIGINWWCTQLRLTLDSYHQ